MIIEKNYFINMMKIDMMQKKGRKTHNYARELSIINLYSDL